MNTEDIRKLIARRKYPETVPDTRRFDVEFKREEINIKTQRRRVLLGVQREKDKLLNDYIQINVKTSQSRPCESPASLTSAGPRSASIRLSHRKLSRSASFGNVDAIKAKTDMIKIGNPSNSSTRLKRGGDDIQLPEMRTDLRPVTTTSKRDDKNGRQPMVIPVIKLDGDNGTAVMYPNSTTQNGHRVLLSTRVSSRLRRTEAILKSLELVGVYDAITRRPSTRELSKHLDHSFNIEGKRPAASSLYQR